MSKVVRNNNESAVLHSLMIAFKSAVLHLISIKHKPAVKQLLYLSDTTSQESSAESELQTDICSALSWGCELGGVPVHKFGRYQTCLRSKSRRAREGVKHRSLSCGVFERPAQSGVLYFGILNEFTR